PRRDRLRQTCRGNFDRGSAGAHVIAALAGKTALLTGALGTLGRAQARTLGVNGAKLLLLDRPDAPNGEASIAEIARETGSDAIYVGQDLNDLSGAEAAVRHLAQEHAQSDILINNGALALTRSHDEPCD